MRERLICYSCKQSIRLDLIEAYVSLEGNECPLCHKKVLSDNDWEKVKNAN